MFFFKILSRLPFTVLYGISDFVAFILYHFVGYRKKVVLNNLRNSFPEKTEKEIVQLAKDFYRHLADVFIEFFKGIAITKEEVLKRAVVLNPEGISQYTDKGISVLMVAGHQGNWEWAVHAVNLSGVKMDIIYKKLSSDSFNDLTLNIRNRFGSPEMIEKNDSVRKMFERQDIPRTICLAADQVPGNPRYAYWTKFMHQDTDFFTGMERFARQFNCAMVFAEMRRVKRGHYVIEYFPLAEAPYSEVAKGEIMEKFVRKLEESVQKNPAAYLWSHKRWKHQKPSQDGIFTNFSELVNE